MDRNEEKSENRSLWAVGSKVEATLRNLRKTRNV